MIDKYNGITVEYFPVGMMEVNCYLVYDAESKEGIVVDPGDEGSHIMHMIEDRELKVDRIVLTHGHVDHIGALEYLRKRMGMKLAIGAGDENMLTDPSLNLSSAMGSAISLGGADIKLNDGDNVGVGRYELQVVETPGHTEGGITLVGNGFVISGDLIFAGSIGRVDLPGGNYSTIINSIKSKILPLGDDFVIYPGHGPKTSVAQEKIYNPFLIEG